jgi:hypothetical protein
MRTNVTVCAALALVLLGSTAGTCLAVTVPDNGGGTAEMPLHVDYYSVSPMYIIDGLPAGTNITIDAVQAAPSSTVEQPGGSLSGNQSAGVGSGFQWDMHGTGALAGFHRQVFIPFSGSVASFPAPPGSGYEVHSAPRTPGAPVQSFDTMMFRLFGQILGDPDFDLLRVAAGTDFGMPSPGHTTLTAAPGGNWAVDSFFDITYRIDFVGRPGGSLAGMSGSTTGTVRLAAVPEPCTLGLLAVGGLGLLCCAWRRRRADPR